MKAPAEHYGFLSKTVLPSSEKGILSVPAKTIRAARELLVGWAADIPGLDLGTEIARRIL